MKTILLTSLAAILCFTSIAQTTKRPSDNGLKTSEEKTANLKSYETFKASAKPLVDLMGTKAIVGLGEGTHGTAEFYKVRFWITRLLVEEYGFNHIAFENDYSDSWLLDKQLNTGANLDSLMKKRMLSIWQNKETKEMLSWVRYYNENHTHKLTICGLDYVFATPDVEVLRQLLTGSLVDSLATLKKAAAYYDEFWNNLNRKGFQPDYKILYKYAYHAYLSGKKLDSAISKSSLSPNVKNNCHLAVENITQAFAAFYDEIAKKPEASRDSLMALNAKLIMQTPGTKMVIWAHDAHMAKMPVYDGEVGGTGGYLSKMFPGKYFVLATGTANGTFAATKDSRDTRTNPMSAFALEKPIKGSWEELLAANGRFSFYFIPAKLNAARVVKPFRIIGYGPDSGPKSYDKTNLSDLFDAYLFIRDTKAATPLN